VNTPISNTPRIVPTRVLIWIPYQPSRNTRTAAAIAQIHHQVENDQPNSVCSVPATTCAKIR
jgi:hypothetical protein